MDSDYPFPLFRFHVEFKRVQVDSLEEGAEVDLCRGAFSECSGLEATMEPKVIKAGGANYGPFQRVGQVTFGTVILKRGITTNRHLWKWFSHVSERANSAFRLNVIITVEAPGEGGPEPALIVRLARAMPIKLKIGDLNGTASEVGIEELHLAHEGLSLETP
jgi:phage tail-like protein